MEQVRKTFFNPLATSKVGIRDFLQDLPVGSAHPYSPEQLLLCRTSDGINEIDISSYPQSHFFNAVNLGDLGETLFRRMSGFKSELGLFDDFQIMQAPAATFKIPIVSNQITIFAVSEMTPTYYDLCLANGSYRTCCYCAENTFRGVQHSGDIINRNDFLAHVKLDEETLTEEELCVFISGYQQTCIRKFQKINPALLVADHVDKVLYIIPVPLDAATIGDATICCPLVIKKDGESLICSVLPTATTDVDIMCHGETMKSEAFSEAIQRADFILRAPPHQDLTGGALEADTRNPTPDTDASSSPRSDNATKEHAVIATPSTTFPSFLDLKNTQTIRFGTGLEFQLPDDGPTTERSSAVVLPCIFGTLLEGPFLLATGTIPFNIPFSDDVALREYYSQLKSVVVVVDERMTDNARNLAPMYRINALFIVQLNPENPPTDTKEVEALLNAANINAVTALAGPQSLVLVQVHDKYYFYRGIANGAHLNTSATEFGADVTSVLETVGVESILHPGIERIVSLDGTGSILIPSSGQRIQPQELERLFDDLSIDQLQDLEDGISAAVPQLQVLLNQKDLQALSQALISALSLKITNAVAPLRNSYIKFLKDCNREDPEQVKKKNIMLGKLRRTTKEMQVAIEPLISTLANMISSQTTSKRTHDLKRLVRQAQIQGNVEAVKSMTFDTLGGYLETYAADMGVMLLNIRTDSYHRLLKNLHKNTLDVDTCCNLDSRVLHLEGFDAGIIIEQSQSHHDGPLRSQSGPSHPTLALPCLNQESGSGSMLAWVCWDEFVNLESPYSVRWMEKCNDAHIAALRIIMRSTLSQAVASRSLNLQPNSPETGHLMSALLMSAMSKLAALRTTTPLESKTADNTVTRLMRGLFGNLLTIAGSGVRPLSMVWQLFGANSQNDLPKTPADWIWYETVVALYPYTGWPRKQFYANLERLLDKAIIHVVTTNEDIASLKANRIAEMVQFCKLRNIQLQHSRSIITVLMRLLTSSDGEDSFDLAPVAARLLAHLPSKLEKQTSGYSKMIRYLKHLATGGARRATDDLVIASTYTVRSAGFGELKAQVAEACKSKDWSKVKILCQEINDKHTTLAKLWKIQPGKLKVQNKKVYDQLLATDFDVEAGSDVDENTKTLIKKVSSDAEASRVPWLVGKVGEFGDEIEPLDEGFVAEMLTGEKKNEDTNTANPVLDSEKSSSEDDFAPFAPVLRAGFVTKMQKALSAEDVCAIMSVPPSAMRVFVDALNPQFVWEDLGENFREVILGLLRNRSGREGSAPAKRLLELGEYRRVLRLNGE